MRERERECVCVCVCARAKRKRSRAPVQAFARCTPLSIRANRPTWRCVWRATFHMHRVPHDAQKSDTSLLSLSLSLSLSLGYRPDIDLMISRVDSRRESKIILSYVIVDSFAIRITYIITRYHTITAVFLLCKTVASRRRFSITRHASSFAVPVSLALFSISYPLPPICG